MNFDAQNSKLKDLVDKICYEEKNMSILINLK